MIEQTPNQMNKDIHSTTTKKRSLFVYSHQSKEELSLLSNSDDHNLLPFGPITPPGSLQPYPFTYYTQSKALVPTALNGDILSPSKKRPRCSEDYDQNNLVIIPPIKDTLVIHQPPIISRMDITPELPSQHSYNHPSSMMQAPVEDDIDLSSIKDFKLPASKSPIMEAMVVCGLNGWGIDIVKKGDHSNSNIPEIIFKVTDFNRYYRISRVICSKQRPTDDLGSRIKALKRWFVDFPKKKYCCNNSFILTVKPKIVKKVLEMIDRNEIYKNLDKN